MRDGLDERSGHSKGTFLNPSVNPAIGVIRRIIRTVERPTD